MGKIIVSENVTLDGVVQDPLGEEGLGRSAWFATMTAADQAAWAEVEIAEALEAEALLLGRKTDEWFAARWLGREGIWADRLNAMPKYIVSTSLDEPRWSDGTGFKGTILRGDVVKEVTKLKRDLAGDLVVYSSAALVRTLLEHDLVDEVRLTVHPFVLGDGERLFGATTADKPLRLVSARTLGDGIAYLVYRTA